MGEEDSEDSFQGTGNCSVLGAEVQRCLSVTALRCMEQAEERMDRGTSAGRKDKGFC